MNTPFLSIIIPVYNTGDKLERCITSILNQQYGDYEILLIDDGSTDDISSLICDRYSDKYENIRTVHKPNGGVSSARNVGIEVATGKWISFIDSDDYIVKDWYSCFSQEVDNDLIMQGYTFIDRGHTPIKILSEEEEYFNGNRIVQFILKYENLKGYPLRASTNKFFKKRIIDEFHISFDKSVSCGEDYLFNLTYILHINSIKVLPVCSYIYERMETGLALKKHLIDDYVEWQLKIMDALVKITNRFKDEGTKEYFYKEYSLNLVRYILHSNIEDYQLSSILKKIELHISHFKKYVCNTKYVVAFLPNHFRRFISSVIMKLKHKAK